MKETRNVQDEVKFLKMSIINMIVQNEMSKTENTIYLN